MVFRVGVLGAKGRMGAEVCKAIRQADDMRLVADIDAGDPVFSMLTEGAEIVVDFTTPEVVVDHLKWLIENGIHAVIGTTGISEAAISDIRKLCELHPEVGVLIAPNFSVGAILMMKFAKDAAKFFESTEIIEMHHPNKVDAPSGTAKATAERISAERSSNKLAEQPDATQTGKEARGVRVAGIPIHSVRMSGLIAHQEVLFGNAGELLSIRHDSMDRAAFMPGVLTGIREVGKHPGLTVGLENYLGI